MTVNLEKLVSWWRDITTLQHTTDSHPVRLTNASHTLLSNLFRSLLIPTSNICICYNVRCLPLSPRLNFALILFSSSLIQRILAPGKCDWMKKDSSVFECDAVFTYSYILNKCLEAIAQQCGVTSQKNWILNAAVETTYLTWDNIVWQKSANVERHSTLLSGWKRNTVELSIYWTWRQ